MRFRLGVTRNLLALLLLHAAFPLAAQERPKLPAGKDTNDWTSYQEQGLREIDRHPGIALRYFEFASRLDPSVAEPLLARYAAWWRFHGNLKNRMWFDKPSETDSTRVTELWLDDADLRNPFARQGVLTWTLPKRHYIPDDEAYSRGLRAFYYTNWHESVHELTTAIERQPETLRTWSAYRYRALAHAQLGEWKEGGDDIEQLLQRIGALEEERTVPWDLGKARLYYTLALMRLFEGRRDRAREAFQRVFEIDLGFAIGHLYYGNMLLDDGDTTAGLREYAMAAELQPSDPFIRQNYGAVLFNLGRLDSALTHLTDALRLAPDYAILYFNRAICLEQLGRADEARAMHSEFVARAPLRMKPLIQQSQRFLNRAP